MTETDPDNVLTETEIVIENEEDLAEANLDQFFDYSGDLAEWVAEDEHYRLRLVRRVESDSRPFDVE